MSSAASPRSLPTPAETAAQAMMRRETRVTFGEVPRTLLDDPLGEMTWQMLGDGFLLRGEGHHYFHYRKGRGITIERGPDADLGEESLWLNGSVYSAIASLNGLVPIHASAVAFEGRVFAFSAPAAGGKSTLAAALAGHGLPLFCDDTLVLDLSDPHRVTCLPGHKRLKLRPDAIALTGATAEEKVSKTVDKYYARPAAVDAGVARPLAELIFVDEGPDLGIEAITGAERMIRFQDDHQTAHLFAAAQQLDRAARFAHLHRLASRIKMARLERPRDRSRFAESVALAARYIV
ncbi:MAG TPA: hypothetical protein VIZ66_11105, partial [Sphingomicrobium sp.]